VPGRTFTAPCCPVAAGAKHRVGCHSKNRTPHRSSGSVTSDSIHRQANVTRIRAAGGWAGSKLQGMDDDQGMDEGQAI